MAAVTVVAKQAGKPNGATSSAQSKVLPANDASSGAGTGEKQPKPGKFHPSTIFLYFLGITMTISGNATSWNLALSAGLYSYIIMYFAMGLAYVAFCLCISEVTSTLPFAGGAFGLARCTLGFFPAFLIGCAETLEYVASVAFQAICAIDVIAMAMPSLAAYKPLLWLLYYIPTTIIQCVGGVSFWMGVLVLGVMELALVLLHNFGGLGLIDYQANVEADPLRASTGGLSQALVVFPFFAWLFLGVEAINLASDDVLKPRRQIPVAQIACIATLFCVGIFTSMVAVSLPMDGGIAAVMAAYTPQANGFMLAYNIDPSLAPLMIMPSEYAGAYGLQWASAKLIQAMGASKLLPPYLATTSARFGTPYVAIIVSSVLGYTTCLLVYYAPSVTSYLLPLCLLFAFSSYLGQCIGYISLRLSFPIVKQCQFTNPIGVYGAIYAIVVWMFGIVGVLGFQGHHGIEALFYVILIVVLAVYYQLYAKKRQVMSEEESKILLTAHISRFNQKRKSRVGGKRSSVTSNGPPSSGPARFARLFSSKNTKYKTETSSATNPNNNSHGQ